MGTKFGGKSCFVFAPCNSNCIKSHIFCKLHCQVPKTTEPENGYCVISFRASVAQRIERGYACAQQRRRVEIIQSVRDGCTRRFGKNGILSASAIEGEAWHLQV